MDLVRIGNKVVSRNRIVRSVMRILSERERGASQQEVSRSCGVDRSFVSWLEKLGEVRKGGRIAVVGFPVGNKDELEQVAVAEAVEFTLLMTDEERWEFVRGKTGEELINEILSLIRTIRQHDAVVFLGSDERLQIMKAMVDIETVDIELGRSPLSKDVYVSPEMLKECIRSLKG